MSKERFTDNTYSVAKGLTHIHIAKQYFEDVKTEASLDVKMIFNQYIQKCEWILANLKDRLSEENRMVLNEELENSLTVDAIADKVILLDNQKKDFVESVIDRLINGEEIIIVDEEK